MLPVWAILGAMGLVIPNAPAVALSRHPDAAGTAAALLGAAQFGLGAAVAPLVGVLGNDEFALALVMTVGVVVALFALALRCASGPGPPAAGARVQGQCAGRRQSADAVCRGVAPTCTCSACGELIRDCGRGYASRRHP